MGQIKGKELHWNRRSILQKLLSIPVSPADAFKPTLHPSFFDKLRKPKNHQRPLTQAKTQFNLKDISFSTKIRITIEKQTRTF